MIQLLERVPDEAAAYEFLESLRWGNSPKCSHCDSENVVFLNPTSGIARPTRRHKPSQRRVWKCRDCKRQFSVLTGTVMHGTHIPIRTWVFVLFEMVSNKNGVAAREVERRYDLTPKAAWFLTHRIREGMRLGSLAEAMTGTIVADETFIGGEPKNRHANRPNASAPVPVRPGENKHTDKVPVLSLINKDTGEVRSRVIPDVTGATLGKAIAAQVNASGSHLHTDSWVGYGQIGRQFQSHGTVNHREGKYVRGNVTTNHAEGFFSQLKRSIDGTHHHVSVEHLGRYLNEFDFRYSTRKMNDTERLNRLMGQVGGRRLTYRSVSHR